MANRKALSQGQYVPYGVAAPQYMQYPGAASAGKVFIPREQAPPGGVTASGRRSRTTIGRGHVANPALRGPQGKYNLSGLRSIAQMQNSERLAQLAASNRNRAGLCGKAYKGSITPAAVARLVQAGIIGENECRPLAGRYGNRSINQAAQQQYEYYANPNRNITWYGQRPPRVSAKAAAAQQFFQPQQQFAPPQPSIAYRQGQNPFAGQFSQSQYQ